MSQATPTRPPGYGTRGKNYDLLTASVYIPAWFKKHRATLLKLKVYQGNRDETGVMDTEYAVVPSFIDQKVVATGGGISAAMRNEKWQEDQIATIYTDLDPGDVKVQDAFLLLGNVFTIEATEPVGVVPVAWKIHGVRVIHPEALIGGYEKAILAYKNGYEVGQTITTQNPAY